MKTLLLLTLLVLAGCAQYAQQSGQVTDYQPPPPEPDRTETAKIMAIRLVSSSPPMELAGDPVIVERTLKVQSRWHNPRAGFERNPYVMASPTLQPRWETSRSVTYSGAWFN